jgi:hypothetical protein
VNPVLIVRDLLGLQWVVVFVVYLEDLQRIGARRDASGNERRKGT